MKANETQLQPLLEGTKQYIIPLFQRTYSWTKRQWNELWRDLMDVYASETKREHFMGAIVTMPVEMQPQGVSKYLLIDGQQRLTTIFIILAAIRDLTAGTSDLADQINELYLVNKWGKGINRLKLLPTAADRRSFQEIVDGKKPSGGSISDVYQFFKRKLSGGDSAGNLIDLDRMTDTLMQHLAFVSVVLSADDSPYRIFHSLNGTGVPLTQADLVRNHFFMLIADPEEQEAAYTDLWLPMQQTLGDKLTDFMWRFITKDGTPVTQNRIYEEMQVRTEGSGQQKVIDLLLDMHTYAEYYSRLLDPEQEPNRDIRLRIERINRWEINTAYPFLLNIYHDYEYEILSADQVCQVIDMIESFVIRRFFCRIPTNSLNNTFIAMYRSLDKTDIPGSMERYLLARRWPSDAEFLDAWRRLPIFLSGTEKSRHILETLEQALNTNNEPVDVRHPRITREHVMPQELTDAWVEMLGEDAEVTHSTLLHTVGNLTLTGMNKSMGNRPFAEKKKVFAASGFALNQYFEDIATWNGDAITGRAESLGNVAASIWQRPATDGADSFAGDDPTGYKPTGFMLLGEEYSASTWRDVLLESSAALAAQHGNLFAARAMQSTGMKRQNIAVSPDAMISPAQIEGTQLWIETNQSARSVLALVRQLLHACGDDESDFTVDWE